MPDELSAHQLARALPWLERELVRQRDAGTSAEWLVKNARAFPYSEDENPALAWLVALLDAPGTSEAERTALFTGLIDSRVEAVVRRADVPVDLLPQAAFALPTEECFDRLTPHLDILSTTDALDAFTDAHMMWHPADERWFDYWQRRLEGAPADQRLSALRKLAEAARVDRNAAIHARIGYATVELLATMPWQAAHADLLATAGAWKHPAAADIQLMAVAESAATYNDRGHRTLAARLSTMHSVGRAEHLPRLEQLAEHVASITNGSRAAAAWFGAAIAAIRART